jgi:predicted DNA-binding protein (MmcQ/YjbR family)
LPDDDQWNDPEASRVPSRPITRLRKLCQALSEAHEVVAWGEPTFRVRNKMFAMYADAANHHGNGRDAVWVKAAPGDQAKMVGAAPECFFVPPYVGPKGWVGIWLDGVIDWDDVAEFLRDGYRLVAPKRLCALLDQGASADD